jgi:hypothetical protein
MNVTRALALPTVGAATVVRKNWSNSTAALRFSVPLARPVCGRTMMQTYKNEHRADAWKECEQQFF